MMRSSLLGAARCRAARCCPVAVSVSRVSPLPAIRAQSTSTSQNKQLKLIGPEPKTFGISEGQLGQVASAAIGPLVRLGGGVFVKGWSVKLEKDDPAVYSISRFGGRMVVEYSSKLDKYPRPELALQLFEFEACPYCKKVREALAMLDLDAVIYPCPKEGPTWRKFVEEKEGKTQFPYLVDPNKNTSMFESDVIVHYLWTMYGDGDVPESLRSSTTIPLLKAGSAARGDRGRTYRPSRVPDQPLVLWGYEGSPFVKLAKEALSELELPYLLVACARGSPKRQILFDNRGVFQVPYLEDPNEGVAMFESASIVQYLEDKYALKS